MTLSTSNTFITPQNTSTIGGSRTSYNGSLRALLQNFYSSFAPVSANISDDGTTTTPPLGTLFVSATTHALYRKVDSTLGLYASPTGQYSADNFSRRGISYRVETDSTSALANIGRYEIGESYFRLDGLGRPYFKDTTGSSNAIATLVDVSALTVSDNSITPAKLTSGGFIQWNNAGVASFGNTNTTVRTGANVYIKPSAVQFPPPALFVEPSGHASSRHTRIDLDNWNFRQDISGNGTKDFGIYNGSTNAVYVDTSGNIGFGNNTAPLTKVGITGSLGVTGAVGISGALTVASVASSGAVSGTTGTFSSTVQGVAGTFSGALTTSLTTEAISTSTGALRSSGGIAAAGNVHVGGNVVCSSQGVLFSDASRQTSAFSVYTGSSTTNTDYPIGTMLAVYTGIYSYNRNESSTIKYDSATTRRFVDVNGSGTTLTGTWRSRGECAVFQDNSEPPQTLLYFLFQRTA